MSDEGRYHALRCQCGQVAGQVALRAGMPQNRVTCFCRDCQAFARWTGEQGRTLDAHGGTDVIQVAADRVTFQHGADQLACIKLREKGLLRWYTRCCRTPVGNTMATPSAAFVGLVHTVMEHDRITPDFGPVSAYANSTSAIATGAPKDRGLVHVVINVLRMVLGARWRGGHRRTPFFTADGQPVSVPHVLSPEELARSQAA